MIAVSDLYGNFLYSTVAGILGYFVGRWHQRRKTC
jgi:hypothetical protein